MTAATYSSTAPLQGKRIWHGDVIDRLLLLWPAAAVATGAILLWIFGLTVGAAITFGLLAGCAVALAWTFVTAPYARLRDGLKTYDIDTDDKAPPKPKARRTVFVSREEAVYLLAAFHR